MEGTQGEPITIALARGLSVKLYPDFRPTNLEIGGIQKGLVLVADGEELVEEGAGFGVPVARYRDKTYFPGSSSIEVLGDDPPRVRKMFDLDTVSMKSLGGHKIRDSIYRPLHAAFHTIYISEHRLRPVLNMIMGLRNDAGVTTMFEKKLSRGIVQVTYEVTPNGIEVEMDMRGLEVEGIVEVAVLNEQGARFSRYSDSSGLVLKENRIGGWEAVTAPECTLTDPTAGVSFTLRRADGSVLRRGREAVKGRFSWAGLNYTLYPSPETFKYRLKITNRTIKEVDRGVADN